MATDRLFNQTQGDSLLSILAQIRDGYNSVDGAFSLTSENPLQNKKITGAVTDTIETLGGTAQKSYAIGQYFLANDGYYYVATAAITAGSSNISSSTGGNCSKTCITAAMNNLSSQISNLNSALANKSDIRFNLMIAATGSTTSIADLVSNTPDGYVVHYYVHNSNMITDWGTKTQTYYADIKCARYGSNCNIEVTGCNQGGAPLKYIGQKINNNYQWKLATLS